MLPEVRLKSITGRDIAAYVHGPESANTTAFLAGISIGVRLFSLGSILKEWISQSNSIGRKMGAGSRRPSIFQAWCVMVRPGDEAISNAERLAIEVIADRIAHGELPLGVSFTIPDEQLARQ
jgi:hypothetical protein